MLIMATKVQRGKLHQRPLVVDFIPTDPGTLVIGEWLHGRAKRLVQSRYFVWKLASDFGKAYRFERYGTDRREDEPGHYDVLLAGDDTSCECKGWLRWGHCKHVGAAQALVEQGDL